MVLDNNKIKEILFSQHYVSEKDLVAAEEYANAHNSRIVDYLFTQNIISPELYGQALAEHFRVPFANLRKSKIAEDVLHLIPEVVTRNKGVIAFNTDNGVIHVGFLDPKNVDLIHLIQKRVGGFIKVHVMIEQDFLYALESYAAGIKDSFKNLLTQLADKTVSEDVRDELTIKMVDMLLQHGYQNKASDIHIEPYESKIVVRLRIDGIMHDVLEMPKDLAKIILSRIKILAKMRTDEHRAAQDGKLRYQAKDEMVDVRVSVVPITQGENVVMRLLTSKNRQFDLPSLGLRENDLAKVLAAIKHPHGMILVTGPTGSGKTTSLYAIMKILHKKEVNIATIEDPVEYDIEGIGQIQVNTNTGLTFASGLRAIVRQDPDIIMVGEIRDEETADIAVNSALTGHLVLSTLHTNDAATTLPRLLDMNVEPFLVSSTVNIAIAQRLIRKICEKCRVSYSITAEEKKVLSENPVTKKIFTKKGQKTISSLHLYKGAGCKVCGNTGYDGRIGVFEIIEMSEEIKKLILARASSGEIEEKAKEEGMTTMFEDGMAKVSLGITTIEEVMRVTRE